MCLLIVVYGPLQGALATDEEAQITGSCNPRVKQIALQHQVVLCGQWDDHRRIFRPLALVHSRGVGQRHLVQFADAGTDLPQCSGTITSDCESANNDTVERDSAEANPYHIPLIDQSGLGNMTFQNNVDDVGAAVGSVVPMPPLDANDTPCTFPGPPAQ